MNQFRRIKLEFDAAERERSKTPLEDVVPTVQATPRVSGTSQRPKSTNARSSTIPRPRPNTAKTEPQPILPTSNRRYGPTPKSTPRLTKSESLQILPKSLKARPGEGEILIAVMGVTGSGKSYFCRAATGDGDIHVGDGLESCNAADTPVKYI